MMSIKNQKSKMIKDIQTSKIECPECGCREIQREYNNSERNVMFFSHVYYHDEDISVEPMWCYCLCCGVKFDPVQEAFAV